MLEDNKPVGLFRVTPSFAWNVVLLGARFVALLRPKMMTGTALEPPLGTPCHARGQPLTTGASAAGTFRRRRRLKWIVGGHGEEAP